MSITSDEVNFLVYRYLQESGFSHSAFTFAYESQVVKSTVVSSSVPPGALISFIQKGLQYVGIEAHVNEDGTERDCDEAISLLSPHTCSIAQGGSRNMGKRKRNEGGGTNSPTEVNGLQIQSDRVAILSGHTAEVFICAWSPIDDLLASSSGDSTARIWQIPSEFKGGSKLKNIEIILPHNKGLTPSSQNESNSKSPSGADQDQVIKKDVTTIEWNGDGSLIASGSYDGQGRIWNKKGELQQTLTRHKGPIFSLKWNKTSDLLLSGSYDKSAIVWNPKTGEIEQEFNFHNAPTLDVDWKDHNTFASCSTDKSIHVCTLGEMEPIKTFNGHTDEVNTITWDPSGTILASCSDDNTAKIWSLSKDTFVHDFREHEKEIYTIKWSPTGPNSTNPNKPIMLASASFDATVKLWDVEAGKCLYTLSHSESVYSIAFSPNGDFLASGALNGALNIWSTKTGNIVKTYSGNGDIYEVDWNYRGDMVAACFSDNNICVVNFRS